jgi:voltage-gated potassium channel
MADKQMLNPIVILVLIYIVSIVFFHFVEDWTYLDAAYFTTMSITTVGYGDVAPDTDIGKLGAMALVFAGVSIAFYIISHLGLLREKKVDPHIQKRLEVLRSITLLQSKKIKKGDARRLRKKIQGVKFS